MRGTEDRPTPSAQPLEDLDAVALAYASKFDVASEQLRRQLRNELTVRCLPFAQRLARRYRGRGEPLEDLEQVARLGLLKAVDRYDPHRGSFTAYAVVTISGEIKRHFRDVTWDVHVPRRLQDLALEVGHATAVLTGTLARTPTIAEIAAHMGRPEDAVVEALESAAGYSSASLNAPAGSGDSGELGDLFGRADQRLESVDDRLTVSRLLLRLPPRERRMLALRFFGNLSQAEIAAELNISQMHVSRLLSRALSWLREAIVSDVSPYWEGADLAVDPHTVRATIARAEGVVTVRVRGEIDRDVAERVRRRIRVAISTTAGTGDRLVADLSAVPLIDAAGVGVLLDAAAAATSAGLDLTIVGTRPYVAHILRVSGLQALLD